MLKKLFQFVALLVVFECIQVVYGQYPCLTFYEDPIIACKMRKTDVTQCAQAIEYHKKELKCKRVRKLDDCSVVLEDCESASAYGDGLAREICKNTGGNLGHYFGEPGQCITKNRADMLKPRAPEPK